MELLSIKEEPPTTIPAALQSFAPAFGPQPSGCDLPRNAWVQLNRLRTGVGRLAANMKLMDQCGSDLCECRKCKPHTTSCMIAKIQTSLPHQWATQPCYCGIPYPIKVLTNTYSCSSIRKKKNAMGGMKSSKMREGRNASKKVGNHCTRLNTCNHLLF